jgi:hypothetical protein
MARSPEYDFTRGRWANTAQSAEKSINDFEQQGHGSEDPPLQTATVDRGRKAEYLAAPMRARMQAP